MPLRLLLSLSNLTPHVLLQWKLMLLTLLLLVYYLRLMITISSGLRHSTLSSLLALNSIMISMIKKCWQLWSVFGNSMLIWKVPLSPLLYLQITRIWSTSQLPRSSTVAKQGGLNFCLVMISLLSIALGQVWENRGECPVGEVVKAPTRSPAKDWQFNPHCGRSEKDIGAVCKQATWLSNHARKARV